MDVPAQFHFRYRRLVEFADTDLAGLMHFANFFRFVESAEHAFFRSLGYRVHTNDDAGHHGWPRLETSCQFHKPARFEQTLEICLRVGEIRTSSLRYGFWIFPADEAERPLLATGSFSIIHVEIDAANHGIRKAPIPPELKQKLEALLSTTDKRG